MDPADMPDFIPPELRAKFAKLQQMMGEIMADPQLGQLPSTQAELHETVEPILDAMPQIITLGVAEERDQAMPITVRLGGELPRWQGSFQLEVTDAQIERPLTGKQLAGVVAALVALDPYLKQLQAQNQFEWGQTLILLSALLAVLYLNTDETTRDE